MEASGGTFSDRTKSSHFSHPVPLSYPIHNKRSCALSYSNTTHTHTHRLLCVLLSLSPLPSAGKGNKIIPIGSRRTLHTRWQAHTPNRREMLVCMYVCLSMCSVRRASGTKGTYGRNCTDKGQADNRRPTSIGNRSHCARKESSTEGNERKVRLVRSTSFILSLFCPRPFHFPFSPWFFFLIGKDFPGLSEMGR